MLFLIDHTMSEQLLHDYTSVVNQQTKRVRRIEHLIITVAGMDVSFLTVNIHFSIVCPVEQLYVYFVHG